MDGVVFGLTEQHLDQIILFLGGAVAVVLIIVALRARRVKWFGVEANLGKGSVAAANGSYKPPCGGANAPEVATKEQLDNLRDGFTTALQEHDGKNDRDFEKLHKEVEKLENKMDANSERIYDKIDSLHEKFTDFLLSQAKDKKGD